MSFRLLPILVCLSIGATIPSPTAAAKNTLFFYHTHNEFTATGKWASADPEDKPAFPSENEIDCFKNLMMCVEASAEDYVGYPHVSITYLKVVRWDKDGILATNSSGLCMTLNMQIVFAEKRISSTHSMKQLPDEQKKACNFFGAKQTEEDIFIVKGSERWNKEHTFGLGEQ